MASQEKREFDKYLKFFTIKAVQVVVQSLDGTKMKISSNPSGTDWFNVVLSDNRNIVSELRQNVDPPYPIDGRPVKVEITAETAEGDTFLVEVWEITLDSSKRDVTVSVSHSLYPRLSLLLKSMLATSRSIPSYHLSRSSEELKFKYVLSSGSFAVCDGLKKVKLGECVGPFGAVSVLVYYRTCFTIPERIPSNTNPIPSTLSSSEANQSVITNSNEDSFHMTVPNPITTPGKKSQIDAPFSSFLFKQTQRQPSSEISTPASELESLYPTSRQDSDDHSITSIFTNRNEDSINDGFVVLNMKPAFTSNKLDDNHDASELLMLCTNPPYLDMFSEGEGTNVSSACIYLDTNQQNAP